MRQITNEGLWFYLVIYCEFNANLKPKNATELF